MYSLLLSILPLRSEASHRSEMVSQILFGESFEILEKIDNWKKIKLKHDQYEGWVDCSDIYIAEKVSEQPTSVLADHFANVLIDGQVMLLPRGVFITDEVKVENNSLRTIDPSKSRDIGEIAKSYLNCPYLWGGRTPAGIDCSGFTQMVYRFMGENIPRDASQQIMTGEIVENLSDIKIGDLAFFENETGKITHVGLMLDNNAIIHASGKVRIDRLDEQGIWNDDLKIYSHKLNCIKRIL